MTVTLMNRRVFPTLLRTIRSFAQLVYKLEQNWVRSIKMGENTVLSKEGREGKGRKGREEREALLGGYCAKKNSSRIRVLNSASGPEPEFKTQARLSAQKSANLWPLSYICFFLFTKKNLLRETSPLARHVLEWISMQPKLEM
jgi:hypothetical protein